MGAPGTAVGTVADRRAGGHRPWVLGGMTRIVVAWDFAPGKTDNAYGGQGAPRAPSTIAAEDPGCFVRRSPCTETKRFSVASAGEARAGQSSAVTSTGNSRHARLVFAPMGPSGGLDGPVGRFNR
jgi:hypothetical protein